jgi:DNA (cytosine-5)-methyltransferase 1
MQNLHDYVVIDMFCGVGGLTHGLIKKGMTVAAGYDLDGSCKYAYEKNNKNARFIKKDIKNISSNEINELYGNKRKILVGCAPCQPFSSHTNKLKEKKDVSIDDDRWKLLYEFKRLIEDVEPDIVSMENVPLLVKHKVFDDFIASLKNKGYHISNYKKIVYCPDYGIAQKRQRLVLLASKFGDIQLIPPDYVKTNYKTVIDEIGKLPRIKDGETHKSDPLHRARKMSPLNLERIKAITEGQNWTNLSEDLISPCHKTENGKTFTIAYGRMKWHEPSPTITTHCIGFSNGRFGHPTQNRAISLREAALLQSFPKDYDFIDKDRPANIAQLAKHIGNAVPPKLGEVIAMSIKQHIEQHGKQS